MALLALSYSAEIVFKRKNLTSARFCQILTSNVDPRAVQDQ